jgi:hypothetical protein
VHLVLADGGYVALRPATTFRIDAWSARGADNDRSSFALLRGAMRAVTGWVAKVNSRAYGVTTPTATIGIRGTDFDLLYVPADEAQPGELPGTFLRVREGVVVFGRPAAEIDVLAGRAAYAALGAAPPRLLDAVPAILTARVGRDEARIDQYAGEIVRHMDDSLRSTQLLRPGEGAQQFIERRRLEFRPPADVPPGAPAKGASKGGVLLTPLDSGGPGARPPAGAAMSDPPRGGPPPDTPRATSGGPDGAKGLGPSSAPKASTATDTPKGPAIQSGAPQVTPVAPIAPVAPTAPAPGPDGLGPPGLQPGPPGKAVAPGQLGPPGLQNQPPGAGKQ